MAGRRAWLIPATILIALVALEGVLRIPDVRDALPARRVHYEPSVAIRLDALDNLLRLHPVDVLFAGSSIVRTNVRPRVFDQDVRARTGASIVSFNTGMLGLWPAGAHLYLDRVWLPAAQPRIVVQGIRYRELSETTYALREDQFFGGVIERGWLNAGPIDRSVSWATERLRVLQYRGVLAAELQLWLRGRPGEIELDARSAINDRGFTERWPILPETRARGLLEDTEAYEDSCKEAGCEVGLDAIRRAHALVSSRGAAYVLVNVPEFAARWPGADGARRYRNYLDTLCELAAQEGFAFVDVTAGDPARYSDEGEFSDYYHMSPPGAERFTGELAVALAPIIARHARSSAPEPARAPPAGAGGTAPGSPGHTRGAP